MSDPREFGFNYGRGWGNAFKPPIYLRAAKLARELGEEAARNSAQAWVIEMALRKVRLASTGAEKAIAVAELTRAVEQVSGGEA
jgi:hypothetical protein